MLSLAGFCACLYSAWKALTCLPTLANCSWRNTETSKVQLIVRLLSRSKKQHVKRSSFAFFPSNLWLPGAITDRFLGCMTEALHRVTLNLSDLLSSSNLKAKFKCLIYFLIVTVTLTATCCVKVSHKPSPRFCWLFYFFSFIVSW